MLLEKWFFSRHTETTGIFSPNFLRPAHRRTEQWQESGIKRVEEMGGTGNLRSAH